MYYDILALRSLYGTAEHNSGDTVYTYHSGADYWETIVDTGGEDTIAYNSATGATIDLRDRHWSTLGNRIEFGNGKSDSRTVCIGPDTVIENAVGGSGDDTITGNNADNGLDGGGGNDRLNGKKGSDDLTGGPGADKFIFDTRLGAGNVDTLDFVVGEDLFKLDNDIFVKLGKGDLPGKAFFEGAAAHDASDRIGYDDSTGALIYDKNGNKPGGAVQFAWLAAGLPLSGEDFVVIG
jgi:Ca2+-binding RTX toxin-like protein